MGWLRSSLTASAPSACSAMATMRCWTCGSAAASISSGVRCICLGRECAAAPCVCRRPVVQLMRSFILLLQATVGAQMAAQWRSSTAGGDRGDTHAGPHRQGKLDSRCPRHLRAVCSSRMLHVPVDVTFCTAAFGPPTAGSCMLRLLGYRCLLRPTPLWRRETRWCRYQP